MLRTEVVTSGKELFAFNSLIRITRSEPGREKPGPLYYKCGVVSPIRYSYPDEGNTSRALDVKSVPPEVKVR